MKTLQALFMILYLMLQVLFHELPSTRSAEQLLMHYMLLCVDGIYTSN